MLCTIIFVMRARTVRQVKQKPRNRRQAALTAAGGEQSTTTTLTDTNYNLNGNEEPSSLPLSAFQTELLSIPATTTANEITSDYFYKTIIPPYRMPPQPPGGGNVLSATLYNDSQIPGAAPLEIPSSTLSLSNTNQLTVNGGGGNVGVNGIPLRTHSSKFPIERELILNSNDKGSTTKIPLMNDRSGLHLLQRQSGSVAPDHPPKQLQAWNTQSHPQSQPQHHDTIQATLTGAIPRTPARLPEDVTALAERENNKERDLKESKNAVTKTYHTIKDLISGRFKKDSNEINDELNNVVTQQQNQINTQESEELKSPYSALPVHMRQMQNFNQSQPNIWNGGGIKISGSCSSPVTNQMNTPYQEYSSDQTQSKVVQQRATSQPQLNMSFDRRGSQTLLDNTERRGSLANIDVTDSDDGGFVSRNRRPQTAFQTTFQQQQQQQQQQLQQQQLQQQLQQQQQYLQGAQQHIQLSQNNPHRNSPYVFQHTQNHADVSIGVTSTPYTSVYQQQQQQQQQQSMQQPQQHYTSPYIHAPSPQTIQNHQAHVQQQLTNQSLQAQIRQDILRASFQKQQQEMQIQEIQRQQQQQQQQQIQQMTTESMINNDSMLENSNQQQASLKTQPRTEPKPKQMPGSTASSDYDKSGNHSSNVDSGRGSAAYSSGRKAPVDTSPESSDSPPVRPKENDTEWVDIVDAELRNILEPGMQGLSIRPESTVSGSVSSITPPLPPLSPDGIKTAQTKDVSKLEYGMDSYNRSGRTGPIGPSRAGWPGSSIQKHSAVRSIAKKYEQTLLKRHLFGLDNDQTSTTTRSLDLDSLLGTPWGAVQSVSDSETETQGLRHIRSQLEGLEQMYSEVLRMLGSRMPSSHTGGGGGNRLNDPSLRSARRRHGSLSSLPSSSVSSRPIRDHRRRNDDRRKVRDMKSINKRFQRLESHVVTLARSVAHLSSEMRSQHLVTQELERLRDDLTALRSQTARSQTIFNRHDPEPPNLTNPKRVKKLQKFFGEDPPLIRLFLKKLGYEKYASLFEAERVGMVELPYLGEERLQKLGVPLGPRLRILQEAQISLCKDTTLCIV